MSLRRNDDGTYGKPEDQDGYDPVWYHQWPNVTISLGILAALWVTHKIGLW